jgi:hypothetical protein
MSATASRLVGRTFLNPLLDYLLIGGAASLVVCAWVLASPQTMPIGAQDLVLCVLLCNSAHFASSTVRLYTREDAFDRWPFLTMGLPLAALAAIVGAILFAGVAGAHIWSLYLTWSPYHYAAQAYGLAVMYSFRSGCRLDDGGRSTLRSAALLPFVYTFVTAPGVGVHWLAPGMFESVSAGFPRLFPAMIDVLWWVAMVAPALAFVRIARSTAGVPPLMAPLLLAVNGVWWLLLPPVGAFFWATIFHSVQYLAIITIFHVRDETARPDNATSAAGHALRFYALSLGLGYLLFHAAPRGFMALGLGGVESALVMIAAINMHHFLVDGFIWRLGGTDPNRRIVESAA